MKKTAIQSKIDELKQQRARRLRLWMPTQELDDNIKLLESLLPKEREQIEEAFNESRKVYSLQNLSLVYKTASDYYETNYSQDKKETDGKD